MFKQRSKYIKNKTANKYTETNCIRCGCKFIKVEHTDDVMCPDCKILETVNRITRKIKYQ